jgi:hypothetical protein
MIGSCGCSLRIDGIPSEHDGDVAIFARRERPDSFEASGCVPWAGADQ